MDTNKPLRLLPTLPLLAESITQAGWECHLTSDETGQNYRSIRLYHGQQTLQKDVLYLLRPTETGFLFDDYAYVSATDHPGRAEHLVCPGYPDEEILDQLLDVFAQFQTWEDAMDQLLYRNASLQELCELGAQLLGNPVCIHDDWFVMMAITADYAQIMEPEYLTSSAKGFVPRAVVEDFQYDSDYLETYAHHEAQLWEPPEENYRSLYVNLWDGPVYKGRLLVIQKDREFLKRDYLLAEALTQRAVMLLRRKEPGNDEVHQNMDDIVFSLLQGKQTEPADLAYLLSILHWQKQDRLLCLRLKPHNGGGLLMNQILHRDLFQAFPGAYILMGNQEQCVLLNLEKTDLTASQLHYLLAPLCRDFCLYAGISSPAAGSTELHIAYYQAGAALDHAFRQRSDKWILSFSECAMDHILSILPKPLTPAHMVSPAISMLRDYDRENGTPYYETLREYLLQERDIPRTSQALIIHRTTLLYRLKKIQALINTDLEDPWQRLYLTLSLWILEQNQN